MACLLANIESDLLACGNRGRSWRLRCNRFMASDADIRGLTVRLSAMTHTGKLRHLLCGRMPHWRAAQLQRELRARFESFLASDAQTLESK